MKKVNITQQRLLFASTCADELARQAKPTLTRRQTGKAWSDRAVWYADDTTLMAVVGAHEQRDSERTLAYGLVLRGDRALHLVLPRGWVQPTRRRLVWLTGDLRLSAHHDGHVAPVPSLPTDKPAAGYPADADPRPLHLGPATDWLTPLLDWAGHHPDLDPGHRPNTRSWHCRGQQILGIRRLGNGLRVEAGLTGTSTTTLLDLTGPPDPGRSRRGTSPRLRLDHRDEPGCHPGRPDQDARWARSTSAALTAASRHTHR
ncbi:hypothetical protein UK82_18955 [Frankia sp. ACN1ag]|nr:hypothetical protein UK82_18955 [Frankia sp. ACN1ag]